MNRFNYGVLMDAEPAPGGGGTTLTQQEVDRIRTALAAPSRAAPPPPQAPPPQGGPTKKELETAFWNDPLSMSAAIATQAAAQARANGPGMDTLIGIARQQAREEDPDVFDRYEQEIRQALTALDPQFHQNATVWKNAFNMVRGVHSKEIFEMRRTSFQAPAVPDGPARPGVAPPPSAPKTKLTEEQEYVARKLGVSEESYRFGHKIINEQHGREASPWDAVITTQGRKRNARRAA